MVALGAPIVAVCVWGKWTSQRQAWRYAVPGLNWEFFLQNHAPWPRAVSGTTSSPIVAIARTWQSGSYGHRERP